MLFICYISEAGAKAYTKEILGWAGIMASARQRVYNGVWGLGFRGRDAEALGDQPKMKAFCLFVFLTSHGAQTLCRFLYFVVCSVFIS